MKLISMREFVLERELEITKNGTNFILCHKYAKFLSQPLTLGMFVPCDLDGNVLEKTEHIRKIGSEDKFDRHSDKYEQAKARVLFEGFEMHRNGKYVVDVLDNPIYFNVGFGWTLYGGGKYTNVESLMSRNITLTQQAIKQIGG